MTTRTDMEARLELGITYPAIYGEFRRACLNEIWPVHRKVQQIMQNYISVNCLFCEQVVHLYTTGESPLFKLIA